MPLELNKRIDDLLKRYVKKRREEAHADFELHPATRKLLQDEVGRVFEKNESETNRPLFPAFWPRLALAGAFTAMLLVTVILLNTPQKSKTEFELSQAAKENISEMPAQAQRKMSDEKVLSLDASADKKELFKSERSVPSPASAPLAKSTREISSVSGVATTGGKGFLSEPTGRITSNEIAKDQSLARQETVANSSKTFSDSVVTSELDALKTSTSTRAVGSSVAPAAPASTAASFYAYKETQNRLRFVQQDLRAKYRQNFLSPAQPEILQSFEVSCVGNKVQLFDSDGSVYEGEILAANDKLGAEEAKQNKAQSADFAFRVAGTNQQIKRVVTFTGNFAVTNVNQAATKAVAGKADNFQTGEFARQSGITGNGLIQGKVSIGGTNEFEIQATEIAK
jgi:hypothetical protein